jgi:hypothetical protein
MAVLLGVLRGNRREIAARQREFLVGRNYFIAPLRTNPEARRGFLKGNRRNKAIAPYMLPHARSLAGRTQPAMALSASSMLSPS